jgi:cyclase
MNDLPSQRVTEVAEGITAVLQEPGTLGLSNSCVVMEHSRAIVVDAMLLPEMAAGIASLLERQGINAELVLHTHHHLDHVGGNTAFPKARVVAHPAVVSDIEQMLSNITIFDWLLPCYAGRFTDLSVRLPQPTEPHALMLPRGGRPLVFGPAHSRTDLALWFPGPRVLIAGDLCVNGVTPLAIHGRQEGWVSALEELLRLDPAVIVPGHGPLASVEHLGILRDYFQRVIALGRLAAANGVSADDALVEFDPGPVGDWLEPDRTRQNLMRAISGARTAEP